MQLFPVQIVTPAGKVLEASAHSVTIPTQAGEITVLYKHIPLVSLLRAGTVTVRGEESEKNLTVTSGFLEVAPDASVRILADQVEEMVK